MCTTSVEGKRSRSKSKWKLKIWKSIRDGSQREDKETLCDGATKRVLMYVQHGPKMENRNMKK